MSWTTTFIALGVIALLTLFKYIFPPKRWRKCKKCAYFDLEEGQAGIRNYPVFMQAAAMIPPNQMGVDVNELGKQIEVDPKIIPRTTKWTEFGACMKDEETVVWQNDTCIHWCRSIVLTRVLLKIDEISQMIIDTLRPIQQLLSKLKRRQK